MGKLLDDGLPVIEVPQRPLILGPFYTEMQKTIIGRKFRPRWSSRSALVRRQRGADAGRYGFHLHEQFAQHRRHRLSRRRHDGAGAGIGRGIQAFQFTQATIARTDCSSFRAATSQTLHRWRQMQPKGRPREYYNSAKYWSAERNGMP